MYDARHIANEFIRRGLKDGQPLTPLHVQKLVYFAHARHLVFHKEPLVSQEFLAWKHGPVVRDLFDALRNYGRSGITAEISFRAPEAPLHDRGVTDWSYRIYGHVGAVTLSDLTHAPDGPWARTAQNAVIPNDSIREYFAEPWIADEREFVEQVSGRPEIVAEFRQSLKDFEEGRYYTASGPEEMMGQINRRREERGTGTS